MQRQRGELVPIGEVVADLDGPVQALIPSRSTQHHFTLADQVNQLVGASEATPDRGFMARTMALCSLPRVSDHRKTYFFGLSPTGHRSRQPRLWRGIGGNGSVQRLNRPQIEHRQRVGERRGAGELIVPPP